MRIATKPLLAGLVYLALWACILVVNSRLGLLFVYCTAGVGGFAIGRWWCVLLATLTVPAAAIRQSVSPTTNEGDVISGSLTANVILAVFLAFTLAVVIAIGVSLRRWRSR